MNQTLARLLCTTVLVTGFGLPMAQGATVIDFEPESLAGLYFAGDSFTQGDYTLTTTIDFGIIDTAVSLGTQAPTGNATQFYFNANDGALGIARSGGGLFSLTGFSAAFVPLDPASLQSTVIVAVGVRQDDVQVTASWSFASSLSSHFPFASYAGVADFAAFAAVKQVEFHACSLVEGLICSQATLNNGQFAIDDIRVSAVPEPTSALLLTLGLLGLGLRARRSVR